MNLYTKLRYGQFNYRNADVIELAGLIGKTPGAVAFKLVHLSRQDPEHKNRVKGLANPGRNAVEMYNAFASNWDEMLYESEKSLAKYKNKKIEEISLEEKEQETLKHELSGKQGHDVQRLVKSRVNQSLFRRIILNNYSESCAICNINLKDLLVASHILKWAENKANRLNPQNGLCLCSLHDKAFELGYLGINRNFKIVLSPKLSAIKDQKTCQNFFLRHENQTINLPDKFYPAPEFLEEKFESAFLR